jgi:uncharacterized protein YlxW (UPF0749 family)
MKLGDQNSAANTITALKFQTTTESLSWVVEEPKHMVDHLKAYVPSLEAQVKTLNNKIADLNTELHARELSIEHTTAAKDDFQH